MECQELTAAYVLTLMHIYIYIYMICVYIYILNKILECHVIPRLEVEV